MDETIAQEVAAQPADEGKGRWPGPPHRGFEYPGPREWGEVILDSFEKVVAEGLALPQDQRPAISGTKWPYEP